MAAKRGKAAKPVDDAAAKKKAKKTEQTLQAVTVKVLSDRVGELDQELNRMKELLAASENLHYRQKREQVAAVDDAEMLMNAIRILAAEVPSQTGPGRRARKAARDLLTARRIPYPSTLGAPRNRPKKAKKQS